MSSVQFCPLTVACDLFPIQSQNIFLWVRFWGQEWKSDDEEEDVKKDKTIE